MIRYYAYLGLKTENKEEAIRKVILRGIEAGALFECFDNPLKSLDEIIDKAKDEQFVSLNIDDVMFEFYPMGSDFRVTDYRRRWRQSVKGGYEVDNIRVVRTLLDLSQDFIIDYLYVSSEERLLDYGQEKNIVIIDSTLSSNREGCYLSDGNDIWLEALRSNAMFIEDLESRMWSKLPDVIDEMNEAIATKKYLELYLEAEEYVMSFIINPKTIVIKPHEPFKIKTVEGTSHTDIAFYVHILLGIVEKFGINELMCTL